VHQLRAHQLTASLTTVMSTERQRTPRSRVFVSYSRQEASLADWLRQQLDSAGFEVFRDVESTLPGEEWWRRLMDLIARADVIVFLLSPRSSGSKVCIKEIEYAGSLNKRIVPVVIETVDWQAVPEGLAKIQSVDLTDHSKRDLAFTQLVVAIDTNIDWVHEHTRLLDRAQRWQAKERSAAELLTGTAIDEAERWLTERPATTDAPTILHQQYILASREAERAEQQRLLNESEEQRRILQEQRDKAEASFRAGLDVLIETQERLLEGLRVTRGVTLTTREAVSEILLHATERLKQATPDFIPSSVQMQLAGNEMQANASLAQVFIEQGEFAKAEASAKRAVALAESFYKDDYNPLQRRPGLRQIASLLASLGDIKFQQQQFDEAIELLNESISLRERGVEYYSRYSRAEDWRKDLADSLQRLAIIYLVTGKPAEALEVSQRALALMEQLVKEEPDRELYRAGLAGMLNTVGDGYFETRSFSLAQTQFQTAYDIYSAMLKEAPDNLYLIRWKSICLERFGNIQMQTRDFTSAARFFAEALELKEVLVEADSTNIQFQQDYKIIRQKLDYARERAQAKDSGSTDSGKQSA